MPFEVAVADFSEDDVPFAGDAADYVCRVARGKAAALVDRYPEDIIFTADTVVFCDGVVYEKPSDEKAAFDMLSALVGRWHSVFTGIAVRCGDEERYRHEETRVLFNDISADRIKNYHRQLYFRDKAGGYAIQESGSIIVNKIEGCFYNVMGLPINATVSILSEVGIDLWKSIK